MTATLVYRVLAVGLIAGAAGQNLLLRHKPPSVLSYHAAIRDATGDIPPHIGPWVGKDIPVIARAMNVLTPNVMINRQYINVETGKSVGFMAVHCADAHDMVGHYPLRCYPADGWDLEASRQLAWQFDGRAMVGMEYTFVLPPTTAGGNAEHITIDNFLLRPNGQVLRDMDSLSGSIMGAQGQASGAGQLQIIFYDTAVSPDERQAIFQQFMQGYRPLIDAILANLPS